MVNITIDKSKIADYWSRFPGMSDLFSDMEEVESWIREDTYIVNERIDRWVSSLTKEDIERLPKKSDSLIVMFYILSSKTAIYIYQRLSELNPVLEQSLQITANSMRTHKGTQKFAIVFWDRVRTILTNNSLEQFMSPQRIEAIRRSIEFVVQTQGGFK